MSERISRAEVVHVARLARLDVTDAEVDLFTEQLGVIIDHASRVAALDTDGVEPTAHPLPLANVFRPDVVEAGVDRASVLEAAPATEDNRFRVPRILGEPG